ncbi:cobalamin-dependent protein [Dactylosporangium sp. CA-139114]|uniref:cobalamin-dependent protein n=1 Tax=Dactylosporangium sp. CA-139114 TaxID=3239931 RepID=UPI003D966A86
MALALPAVASGAPSAGGDRPAPALEVLLASMASESHTWGLVYLELLLTEWGHHVTNLGPCVPDRMLVEECLARRPDLLVVSSVNGHGFDEGARVAAALRRHAALAGTAMAIGGKLGTDLGDLDAGAARLLAAGFDLVVTEDDLDRFRAFVGALSPAIRR